ncbi:MAG: hypothetical protein RQ715_06375 [Methylococcales bacterium]|nr:hypothetical protein [Methylococcales bacterium]
MLLTTPKIFLVSGLLSVTLVGCAQTAQDLRTVNQSIQGTQRAVDNANAVMQQAPAVPTGQVVKEAGKQIIMQDPTVREASDTVESSKRLMDSMKNLGK